MQVQSAPASKVELWVGRVMCFVPALMLLAGGVINLAKPPFAVEGAAKMGYAEYTLVPLGMVLIASVVLFLIPRTAVVGAILLTGYLGGAVATHVRAGDPLPQIFIPAIFGAVLWGGLVLRDPRLRAVIF